MLRCLLVSLLMLGCLPLEGMAEDSPAKQLLLLSQGPDGHPPGTHEYVAGQRVLEKCLSQVSNLTISQVRADGDWADGPELLAKVDGVVLFVSEGAKWLSADPKRRAAFAELARRGGGLSVIHWGMGTKDPANIEPFVSLFGACHGGPDRKYKFLETQVRVVAKDHAIAKGIADFKIKEEFYYQLKQQQGAASLVPLLTAEIDGAEHMVAWAWQRADGGRSFGYTGCHYHENWSRPEYQRLLAQGVLWTLKVTPPQEGFPAEVTADDVKLAE
jgi:type 1 glutamine amidotransferase